MQAQTDELVQHLGSIDKGVEFIRQIKKLRRAAAEKAISDELPNASLLLRDWLISLVPEYHSQMTIPKGKLYAILWTCGATYGQIGQIYEVRKATVASMVASRLPISTRKELMQDRSRFTYNLSHVTVSALNQIINEWLNDDDKYKFMLFGSLLDIANAMFKEYNSRLTEFNEDAPSPYDALINAPESRLGS